MPSLLRKIDVWLLRRTPNLWSLQLHLYLLMWMIVLVLAFVIALVTPVAPEPNIGRTYVLWLVAGAPPLLIWIALFVRIDPPVQRKGVLQRTLAVLGIGFAVASALAPLWVYVSILGGRMEALDAIALEDEHLPYRSASLQSNVAFVLGLLTYELYFFRQAPRARFAQALATTLSMFALAWLLSGVHVYFLKFAAWLNAVAVMFGFAVMLAPTRWGKHSFIFELGLCMIPWLGLSSALLFDYDLEDLRKTAASVCWGVLLLSALLYGPVERFRSRPA